MSNQTNISGSSEGSNYGMSSPGHTAGSTTATPDIPSSTGTPMGHTSPGGSYGAADGIRNDDGFLTGLFPDRDSAERAYQGAVDRGYKSDDINLVMSDATRARHFGDESKLGGRETELGNKAAEGAGIGAGIGGTLGAIAAAVAAVGTSIALPGLGLVIAGPLAAALAGAGAGGAAGGLVGALVGWNLPEERVKAYEEGIRNGGILMGMRPKSEDDANTLAQHWRGAHSPSDLK